MALARVVADLGDDELRAAFDLFLELQKLRERLRSHAA